jgi:hypothetical protein
MTTLPSALPVLLLCLLIASCGGSGSAPDPTPPPVVPAPGLPDPDDVVVTKLADNGGRVAWFHAGAQHERIAFDAVVDPYTQNTDVFTMDPNGGNVVNVTAATAIPAGFRGQPEWYPDGSHLAIQAENASSQHTKYNHLAWGINNDLWIIAADGSRAERVYTPGFNGAVLHPHFSHDGRTLVFTERVATGIVIPALVGATPGGENPWTGWHLHVAAVDLSQSGTSILSNHRILLDNPGGQLETNSVTGDGWVVYARTDGGAPYVNDLFMTNLADGRTLPVIDSDATWDEHGSMSPAGRLFAFMSSRADAGWSYPGDDVTTLRTELFLVDVGDEGPAGALTRAPMQLTHMAASDPTKRFVVSDFDWDRSGRRIVFVLASYNASTGAPYPSQTWLVEFPAHPHGSG